MQDNPLGKQMPEAVHEDAQGFILMFINKHRKIYSHIF